MSDGWTYNDSEEHWVDCGEFKTKQEAIDAGREKLGVPFYVAKKRPPKILINIDQLLEDIGVSEDFSIEESVGNWPPVLTFNQEDELSKLLSDTLSTWLVTNGLEPTWFLVDEIERIDE